MKKIFLLPGIIILLPVIICAQEALKSIEEDYYDFLSLQGITERPSLNYRTMSDSMWKIDEAAEHPWQKYNLGADHSLFGDFKLRIYGPQLFMSANTTTPYGQNDGVLWQGRGFNALLTGGIRFDGYGIELTVLPHLAFSQNAPFKLIDVSEGMSGEQYSNKADTYGYFWGMVDAPQRFGDKPFFDWDFGDSEIRYTWKTITAGFGTQAIWLGPSFLNSMLHSNNAPAYPKFDIGLRRQRITIPRLNWYLGDIEARLWVGRLTESDYFDNDDSNNYTMYHGLALAYTPSILPGLTLFFNWIDLLPWDWKHLKYILPFDTSNEVEDDMKASFGISWVFTRIGLEIFGELGVDDYIPDRRIRGYIRYPFHTMWYTVGLKNVIPIVPRRNIMGELLFEWNSMEMSQDFQFQWPYSPYFHHQVVQGYTNRGQWIGAGSGWGGNSQYLGFKLYYPKGSSLLFFHRNNPDNNFIYSKAVYDVASPELENKYFRSWKANFIIGLDTDYFILSNLSIGGGMAYNFIINPYYFYNKADYWEDEFMHNVYFHLIIRLHY